MAVGRSKPVARTSFSKDAGVAALATLTVTGADIVVLPVMSRASAVSVWAPLATVVVFHERCRARWCPRRPAGLLSTRNCTPATPDIVGGVGGEGHRARDGRAGSGSGDGSRGWRGIAAGGARGLEGGDLHDPGGEPLSGCGGAVGAGRGDNAVFGDVAIGVGDDAGGEVRSRRREAAGGDAGPEDQRVGGGGGDGAAVGRRAGARRGGADVERVDRIQAAVLQGADVDIGRGRVEGGGHGVGSGGRRP